MLKPQSDSDSITQVEFEQFKRDLKDWPEIKIKVSPEVALWLAGGTLDYASTNAPGRAEAIIWRAFHQRRVK